MSQAAAPFPFEGDEDPGETPCGAGDAGGAGFGLGVAGAQSSGRGPLAEVGPAMRPGQVDGPRPARQVLARPPAGPSHPMDASDAAAAGPGTAAVEAWEVASAREVLSDAVGALATVSAGTWAVASDDLAKLLGQLDALRAGVQTATVLLTRDAIARGTVPASQQACPGQWVQAHAPSLDPVAAAHLGQVALACTEQRHALLGSLVASGAVGPQVAAVALREAAKIHADLELDTDADEVLGWYLAAAQGHATSKDLRQLSTWLRGRFGSAEANRKGERAHGLNALGSTTLPDGVKRYLLHLCPEYAAILDGALAALSGPAPSIDPVTGQAVRDPRTAARRRAEALIEVVRRAAAADRSGSATATTKLIVTMSWGELLAGLGSAATREGELLDAGTARRLACDADLIPAVLGTDSEILDWGRERRLFDGPLRAAVVARDRGCTFPGCDRPPTWCAAHHVIHWIDGGQTALGNAALLCERHHTIVHRDNLTATVTNAAVTWDLTPHPRPPASTTGYPQTAEDHGTTTIQEPPARRGGGGQPSAPPDRQAGPDDESPEDGPPDDEPPDGEPPEHGPPEGEPPDDEPPEDEPPDGEPPEDEPPEDEPPDDEPDAQESPNNPPSDSADPRDQWHPAGWLPKFQRPSGDSATDSSGLPGPARGSEPRACEPWFRVILRTSAAPRWLRPRTDDTWAGNRGDNSWANKSVDTGHT